jgi:hypothetical protein
MLPSLGGFPLASAVDEEAWSRTIVLALMGDHEVRTGFMARCVVAFPGIAGIGRWMTFSIED